MHFLPTQRKVLKDDEVGTLKAQLGVGNRTERIISNLYHVFNGIGEHGCKYRSIMFMFWEMWEKKQVRVKTEETRGNCVRFD